MPDHSELNQLTAKMAEDILQLRADPRQTFRDLAVIKYEEEDIPAAMQQLYELCYEYATMIGAHLDNKIYIDFRHRVFDVSLLAQEELNGSGNRRPA